MLQFLSCKQMMQWMIIILKFLMIYPRVGLILIKRLIFMSVFLECLSLLNGVYVTSYFDQYNIPYRLFEKVNYVLRLARQVRDYVLDFYRAYYLVQDKMIIYIWYCKFCVMLYAIIKLIVEIIFRGSFYCNDKFLINSYVKLDMIKYLYGNKKNKILWVMIYCVICYNRVAKKKFNTFWVIKN